MKNFKFFVVAFAVIIASGLEVRSQCTSADVMEPGFNFITSSRGCAPFTVEIQTLFLNSTPGTIYHVNWGDGSPVQVYTQVNVYPNGPLVSHLYADAPVACGYQVIIQVENACNPLGSVTLEPINVIVWTEDIVQSAPDEFRVCQGFASSINFTDDSNWNCFPRADARENSDPRWIQWIYGHGVNANRIPNISVDGSIPGGYPYYDPSLGMDPVYPVTDIDQVSLSVEVPPTLPADIGKDFYVTLNNWNTCNQYDEDHSDGTLNPTTPGGDNAPRVHESRIVIVETPTPDFVTRKDNSSNPILWDYCIDDIIYFDNESVGPGGSSLAYTWEFYDGPNVADGLLGTSTDGNPKFSFATGGQKLVRLLVGDNNAIGGCSAVVEKIVNVTPTSIAQISASETRFCKTPGAADIFTVIFNDVSIGSTANTEWKWEFYDENDNQIRTEPAAGFSSNPPAPFTQDYSTPGVYRVVLISRDIVTKCDTRDEINIVIYNNPEPEFIFNPTCEGAVTELIDKTTLQKIKDSEVVRWEWDFDYDKITFDPDSIFNATRPDTLTKKFTYGIHEVALRATNDQNGCNAVISKTVEVFQNPASGFTKDIDQGCSPLTVTLDNTVSGQPVGIDKYVWSIDYGNGFVDTLQSDPADPGFSPTTLSTFENWSTNSKTIYIKLKAISDQGCIVQSALDSIEVLPSIEPGFYYMDYDPLAMNCAPVEVNFKIDDFTLSLLPTDFSWRVSNKEGVVRLENTNGAESQFTHTFAANSEGINNYSVELNANIAGICVGDSVLSVNVNPIPISDFSIDTLEFGCDSLILELEAAQPGLLEYQWTITKGGVAFTENSLGAKFQYGVPRPASGMGNLDLSFGLKTRNYAFCESEITEESIVVLARPLLNASFLANPGFQVYPNATITITDQSAQTNAVYGWDFGDGNKSTDPSPEPHIYTSPGYYTIQLRLEENYCESMDSTSIYIQPVAPEVDFSFDPGQGCAPLTIQFTNLTKYGDIDGYLWNFGGNEGFSNSEDPKHTYYEPGVYSVKLEATNQSGVTDAIVKNMIIEVFPNPHAEFQIRPEKVKLPDDPVYTTNLSYQADSYYWTFGDGKSSTEFEPVHTYLDTGRFDISLIAQTVHGCTDTLVYENLVEVAEGNEILIPNAFTPSLDGPTGGSRYNDGRNDVFFPVTEGVIAYKMQIFNRWGELLFSTKDNSRGWDGYYKGVICPPDVYVYKIEFKFLDGREVMKFGDITLIR